MITVHHLEYSQSFRVLWLLEELGIEYEVKHYKRDPITRLAPKEYKALSPLGTAPVITHGDVVLAETNAIADYIVDVYPSKTLRPEAKSADRVRYLFWLHASQGSLMPVLLINMFLGLIEKRSPFFLRPIFTAAFGVARKSFTSPRLTALLDKAESDLGEAPWFGGEHLTLADIVLSYPMESMHHNGMLGERKNCIAWLERSRALPSFQRAVERDGKDSIIFTG